MSNINVCKKMKIWPLAQKVLLVFALVFGLAANYQIPDAKTVKADEFNPNNIISDGAFLNKNSMSENDIQAFLESKGSLLKDFSQDGKRASKIIYEAAQGITSSNIWANFGHPEWTEDVRINPQAILVTIQKEEGLIEGFYSKQENYNQVRIDWAMGYGYTESTIYDQYRGFYNQVNMASWQLYWNQKRAQGMGYSGYQVGDTMTFSDWNGEHTVHIDNRASAALYRYTPHVYNGNYNFWFYFNKWFIQTPYNSEWVSQNGHPSLYGGDAYQFEVRIKNSGTETWNKNGVFLGTDRPNDRISEFLREGGSGNSGWKSQNRIEMVEDSVGSGETATFRFWMRVPGDKLAGTYREYFRLVAENITWMNDLGVYWDINVRPKYQSSWVSQNAYPSLYPGDSYQFELKLRNDGQETWNKDVLRLGTNNPMDRVPEFTRGAGWISSNRVEMVESSVSPGQTATFKFTYTVSDNMPPGNRREYFRPVADGIAWLNDMGIYWDINVKSKAEKYHYSWVSQNTYPSLAQGNSYEFIISLKNTGTTAWEPNIVRLGTSKDLDRVSGFTRGQGWISSNRVQMQESSVSPGQTATFKFTYTVPDSMLPGSYRENFRLVADGITWMEDYGIYWDVLVNKPHSSWVRQSENIRLKPGEKAAVWVEFRNTGQNTWKNFGANAVKLGTDRPRDRNSIFYYSDWLFLNRIKLDQTNILPGETGRFSFFVSVPLDAKTGLYREYFRPVSESISWLEDNGVYFDIEVIN